MAEKPHWMRRPLWQSVLIVCGVLVWCLYLALCWISSLPLLAQVLLGLALGFTSMASYSTTQIQRSHYRRLLSVYLAQLSMADMHALQRLMPNHDQALSWLPDPSDVELVRWINVGFEKAWPFFKEASSGLIKVQLQAVLNKYRSGIIQEVLVGKINLGNNCPYIQGVKSFPTDEDNKVCLEVQLDWRQNEDQEILVHVLTSGPEYVVQVKHFVMYCVMRLTFTPLSEELPCFAALVISIVEPPLVDFQTRVISGDVKKMPEMQKAVDNTFVAALMDLLVWPGRVVVPFLPGDYSDLEASCVGHLYVQLLEGKDLANKDIIGRSDPYVVLFVRRRTDLIKESSQMHDTSEPVWKEQFMFNVEDSTVQKLTIKVMNLDDTNLNVFVGIAELAINQLEANTQEDLWIDLVGDPSRLRGKCAGKIHLLIEFKPLNLSCAESDSSKALGKSPHSAVPLTQPAGNSHSIGEGSHTGINNAESDSSSKALGKSPHSAVPLTQPAGNSHSIGGGRHTGINNEESDSSSKALGKSPHSAVPSTQPAGNSHSIGGGSHTGRNNTSEGLRAVLEGHSTISENTALRPITVMDVVAPSPNDSSVLDRAQVTADTRLEPWKLADDDEHLFCQEDKTKIACHIDDGVVIAECTLPSEYESREKRVSGFGTTESQQGIVKESQQTSRDFSEGSSIEKRPKEQVVENETGSDADTENELMKRHKLIVGDPAWGLNGLSVEHCNSSIIHEDMFSMEIFEVD